MALPFDKQPKPDGVTGRKKEEWPPLPGPNGIPQYRIDAVYAWLATRRNLRRPPHIAAPLLALVCWLYEHEYHLPSRERLAIWITGDDSRSDNGRLKKAGSIDASLATALGEGEVTEEMRVEMGRVAGRASARRFRYIIPSKELLDVYTAPRTRATSERTRERA